MSIYASLDKAERLLSFRSEGDMERDVERILDNAGIDYVSAVEDEADVVITFKSKGDISKAKLILEDEGYYSYDPKGTKLTVYK